MKTLTKLATTLFGVGLIAFAFLFPAFLFPERREYITATAMAVFVFLPFGCACVFGPWAKSS